MSFFKRRNQREPAAVAVAEPPPSAEDVAAARAELAARRHELLEEAGALAAATRERRERDAERRLLVLRHRAGVGFLGAGGRADLPEPDDVRLEGAGRGDGPLPEIPARDLTPGLLRAGILRDGCLLVRGLVDREAALALADGIDRAFAERERVPGGGPETDGYYEEFRPEPGFDVAAVRPWVAEGGGVLAADSPRLAFEMLEIFHAAGLPELVGSYIGEQPLISAHKTTLRKAEPHVGGAWHQDGAFMGDVRALNLWLSLSRCGDVAPGLDLVPRRLDRIVIEHGAMLDVAGARRAAEEAAGDTPIVRPVFEPGDALFFDEMFLHQTGSDPAMPNPRFAVESWFFGGTAFPADYAPIAV
jgi:hypothetical protein